MDLEGLYAKRADLHTSGGFLEGLYAERPVLHTNGRFSSSLYAESPILHTDRGEQGSRTEVRVGKRWFIRRWLGVYTHMMHNTVRYLLGSIIKRKH